MNILGIESSCDETAASIVKDGRELISSVVATQIDIHALYGGVVPEIASRAHTEAICGVVNEALEKANMTLDDIDAIAVTYAPGLIGALLTGVSFAKGLAFSTGKPLIPVHHIRGHVAANYLVSDVEPPFTAIVVSGGHTSLMKANSYTEYELIGQARDDAAGEAFDKCARVLGLPYPGGAAMDKLASIGDPKKYKFTAGAVDGSEYDFTFSGLKTAVINLVHTELQRGREMDESFKADVAASFTYTLVKAITSRLDKLLSENKEKGAVVLAGGVAANSHLRKACTEVAEKHGVKIYIPPLKLCGDNAAMIASQGYYEYLAGARADTKLNAFATKKV